MKMPIAFKVVCSAVMLSVFASSGALAQNAQWNSLYDRLIRLEANVKNIARSGGGGFQPTQSSGQMRQLLNEVRQMRQQLLGMDARLRRLEKRSGRSGAVIPRAPQPRQPIQFPTTGPSFAANDINQFDVNSQPKIFVEMRKPKNAPTYSQGVPVAPIARAPRNWQTTTPVPRQNNTQVAGLPPQNNGVVSSNGVERQTLDGNQITQVSVAKKLYDRSTSALRSRRYGAAESGFKSFLRKYGTHDLASSAQFMLGETYYIQRNYRLAAQTYLQGYRKFPKSRRSSDTLLKLGMSMGKLGQKTQSCGVLESVVSKYKSSNGAVTRAKKEMKRARC